MGESYSRLAQTTSDWKRSYISIFVRNSHLPVRRPNHPLSWSRFNKNVTIPFPPSTQYQICMYDQSGNTGGCQDIYTVHSSMQQTTCSNYTEPEPLSIITNTERFSWIPQCDTIELTLSDGRPPYIFSAQQALGPPINVTIDQSSSFKWQNVLPWTVSFFISLSDADGQTWSLGPLHTDSGSSACLHKQPVFSSTRAVAGLAVATAVAGALLALLIVYLIYRQGRRKGSGSFGSADAPNNPSEQLDAHPSAQSGTQPDPSGRNTRSELGGSGPSRISIQSTTLEAGTSPTRLPGGRRIHTDGSRRPTSKTREAPVIDPPPEYQDSRNRNTLSPPPQFDEGNSRTESLPSPTKSSGDITLSVNSPITSGGGHEALSSPVSGPSEGGSGGESRNTHATGDGVESTQTASGTRRPPRRLPPIPGPSPSGSNRDSRGPLPPRPPLPPSPPAHGRF